ncbi:ROK family protein [Actinoplanes sp. CA-131856]
MVKIPEALPGGDQSALRNQNKRRVLRELYEGHPLTISGAANVTGLSRPTAQAILTSLAEDGLIVPDGFDQIRTGGRPAQRYRFDADAGRLGGIDIGAHAIAARVTNLEGTVLGAAKRTIDTKLSRAARIDAAAALLRDVAGDGSPIWAVGVGTPGVVDAKGVLQLNVALHDWSEVSLAEELTERLGCPVQAAKETNLAALGEHRTGAAQGVADVLYVHAGYRIGAGILVDGKPFTGGKGWAGEIGRHPALGWGTAPEQLHADLGLDPARDATAEIFARAGNGDPDARQAVDTFAKTLASGAGAAVLALDPQMIVLGGGVARAGNAILTPLRRHLQDVCYNVPEITLSALGEDAVTIGAIEIARDHLRDTLFAQTA